MSTKQESKTTVSHLPEHGPIDENGREILLQVKNASFDIYKGETFSLVGESGSGKTTIGRAVIRVNQSTTGRNSSVPSILMTS